MPYKKKQQQIVNKLKLKVSVSFENFTSVYTVDYFFVGERADDSVFGLANTCLAKDQAPHEDINRRIRFKMISTCFIINTLSLAKYRIKCYGHSVE